MNTEEILKLLDVLIGNIKSIGDAHADEQAKKNLELLISVAKEIHLKIDEVSSMQGPLYKSMDEVAKIANKYLDWLGIEE